MWVLGPCSAESREQVLETASQLSAISSQLSAFSFIYRAGVWKPRTSPHTFQGIGAEGLQWLQEVKQRFGIPVATEVATPDHVREALFAGIDYLWIGARTSANPIAVQEIADAIKVNGERLKVKGLLIKNPVNTDADLWLGNIVRLEATGIPVIAVHRGCNHQPCWHMAHEVRLARPDIPMLLDPSHMSGDAAKVPALLEKIEELGLDGAMIEVHCDPKSALSDNAQQIRPSDILDFRLKIGDLKDTELNWLRAEIDELDDRLWDTLAARMEVSKQIGVWKKAHGVAPFQPERYREIVKKRKAWAQKSGMDAAFVEQLFAIIHEKSLSAQR